MSKLFSTGSAKSEPTSVPASKKKLGMDFFPGKGLGSYHCFGPTEDKQRKLFRSAVLQFGSLATLPNADEAQAHYASLPASTKPKREAVDFDTRRLASILASLTPNDPPSALLGEEMREAINLVG